MSANREVCWFLTLRCNQGCKYCHRFQGIEELTLEDNKTILDKIVNDGIKNITFTGGEALLHPNFVDLLKLASDKGVRCKLITNGSILAKSEKMTEIFDYLDSLTLSIDSVDNDINERLGRGYNHFEEIKNVLDKLKGRKLKVSINTVVTKINLDKIEELGMFLNNYNIYAWRVFKFMPLRETAKVNESMFEISKEDFRMTKNIFASFSNIRKIEYREEPDMESKYILVMPNGNVVITEDGEDVTIGNIMRSSIKSLLENRNNIIKQENAQKSRIRTLVAFDNEQVRSSLLNVINSLDYAEVIDVAADGMETYQKIVDLQPDMVFTKYNLDNMNGLDIVKKSKEQLENQIPVFNIIGNDISESDVEKLVDIAGSKINSIIKEPKQDRITGILRDYNEFRQS